MDQISPEGVGEEVKRCERSGARAIWVGGGGLHGIIAVIIADSCEF